MNKSDKQKFIEFLEDEVKEIRSDYVFLLDAPSRNEVRALARVISGMMLEEHIKRFKKFIESF